MSVSKFYFRHVCRSCPSVLHSSLSPPPFQSTSSPCLFSTVTTRDRCNRRCCRAWRVPQSEHKYWQIFLHCLVCWGRQKRHCRRGVAKKMVGRGKGVHEHFQTNVASLQPGYCLCNTLQEAEKEFRIIFRILYYASKRRRHVCAESSDKGAARRGILRGVGKKALQKYVCAYVQYMVITQCK